MRGFGIALLCACALSGGAGAAETGRPMLLGTSTFPYAATAAAAERTFATAASLSDLYVVQLDDGVPWREVSAGSALPAETMAKWASLRAHAPVGRPVYLALEPLGEDRVHLAPASKGSSVPGAIGRARFDDPALMAAYLAYVRQAVAYFRPTFLNLGVENGELAQRGAADWPAYSRLIQHVMTEMRRDRAGPKMGISFGLQSLMVPATAERAKPLVEASDFIGISFYPYMSGFHERFGAGRLPPAPAEWRQPLAWLRSYTDKPIAITETGYNSTQVKVPRWSLQVAGSPALQTEYVRDLGRIAAEAQYLFVVYYFPIDIGPLVDTLPDEARAATSLWRENGLFTAEMEPKPALAAWRELLAEPYRPAVTAAAPPAPARAASSRMVGFREVGDLCQAPAPATVDLVDTDGGRALQWSFRAKKGAFAWCARPVAAGSLAGSVMTLRVRSDVEGKLILELKTASGDGYFAVVDAGPSWRDVSLRWADFKREGTSGPASPDPAQVTKLIWADPGDTVSPTGERRVLLADWIVQ